MVINFKVKDFVLGNQVNSSPAVTENLEIKNLVNFEMTVEVVSIVLSINN